MTNNSNSIEVPNYRVSDYMIKEPGIYQKPLTQRIKLSSTINLFNYYICIVINHPMETIIVRPKNKEQLLAIKAFIKALKIDFTIEKSPYNPEFVAKIKRGEEQMKAGKGISISIEDMWK